MIVEINTKKGTGSLGITQGIPMKKDFLIAHEILDSLEKKLNVLSVKSVPLES